MTTTSRQHRYQKLALKREFRRNHSAKYAIESSPLWQLAGPNELVSLLGMTIEQIRSVARAPTYKCFDDPSTKPGKEPRHIQEPRELTLRLHYKFAKFLDRIVRPAFLHSATKKRSHVTNAAAHRGTAPVVCTDIKKFYESTSRAQVKAFFLKDLGWPVDLAALMADALTVNGHLPTGSAVSPLLSYFTHRSRFAEIERICANAGCTITLFVDDITVSGKHASTGLLRRIKKILLQAGLVSHKDQSASTGSAVVITGAVREGQVLRLRNKHRRGIVGLLDRLESGDCTVKESLGSKIAAAKCVDVAGTAALERRYVQLSAALHQELDRKSPGQSSGDGPQRARRP